MIKNKFLLQLILVLCSPIITGVFTGAIALVLSIVFGIKYYEVVQSTVTCVIYFFFTLFIAFMLPIMVDEIENEKLSTRKLSCHERK